MYLPDGNVLNTRNLIRQCLATQRSSTVACLYSVSKKLLLRLNPSARTTYTRGRYVIQSLSNKSPLKIFFRSMIANGTSDRGFIFCEPSKHVQYWPMVYTFLCMVSILSFPFLNSNHRVYSTRHVIIVIVIAVIFIIYKDS